GRNNPPGACPAGETAASSSTLRVVPIRSRRWVRPGGQLDCRGEAVLEGLQPRSAARPPCRRAPQPTPQHRVSPPPAPQPALPGELQHGAPRAGGTRVGERSPYPEPGTVASDHRVIEGRLRRSGGAITASA